MTLGERIKQLRIDKNLSQPELGKALGVSSSFITQIEQDKKRPSHETLLKIASFFFVSTDFLLTGKPNLDDNNDDPELEALFRDLKELDANDRAIIMAIARERKKQRERKEKEDKEST